MTKKEKEPDEFSNEYRVTVFTFRPKRGLRAMGRVTESKYFTITQVVFSKFEGKLDIPNFNNKKHYRVISPISMYKSHDFSI